MNWRTSSTAAARRILDTRGVTATAQICMLHVYELREILLTVLNFLLLLNDIALTTA
jgi:hypothetical protein